MAENPQQGALGQQLLTAITRHVSADTNYWGEFEQLNAESLIKAANACEKIVFALQPEQFQTEQTLNISIAFAAWMQQESRNGNWKENYDYFLKHVYVQQTYPSALQTASPPALLPHLKKAE